VAQRGRRLTAKKADHPARSDYQRSFFRRTGRVLRTAPSVRAPRYYRRGAERADPLALTIHTAPG